MLLYTCSVGLESLRGALRIEHRQKKPSDAKDTDKTELYGGTKTVAINNC